MSLARSEMAEQPAVLERLLRDAAGAIAAAAAEIARAPAALRRDRGARLLRQRGPLRAAPVRALWGLPVALATPSLHTLYDAPLDYRDALVIGISQSGASPDVVGVLEARAPRARSTVAITNEPDSPLARPATHVIGLRTGPERCSRRPRPTPLAGRRGRARRRRDAGRAGRAPGRDRRQLARDVPAERRRRLAPARRDRPRRGLRDRVRGGAEAQELTGGRRAVVVGGLPARAGRDPRARLPGPRDRAVRADRRRRCVT